MDDHYFFIIFYFLFFIIFLRCVASSGIRFRCGISVRLGWTGLVSGLSLSGCSLSLLPTPLLLPMTHTLPTHPLSPSADERRINATTISMRRYASMQPSQRVHALIASIIIPSALGDMRAP
jgi:hypothetical protein